ncbi:MAG: hypothetical protein R2911_40195 [Caldilineaceae bacterium]
MPNAQLNTKPTGRLAAVTLLSKPSLDAMNVLGWVYTSLAQSGSSITCQRANRFSFVRVEMLRAQIDEWIEQFGPEKAIPNDGYFTWGVPVPLAKFEKCCQKIETITQIDKKDE